MQYLTYKNDHWHGSEAVRNNLPNPQANQWNADPRPNSRPRASADPGIRRIQPNRGSYEVRAGLVMACMLLDFVLGLGFVRWKEQQNSFRWGVSVWRAYAGLCYPPNQLIQKALNVIELDAFDDLKENDRLVKCVRYQSRWLPYMYILLICALISSNKCTDEKKQVKAVQDSPSTLSCKTRRRTGC